MKEDIGTSKLYISIASLYFTFTSYYYTYVGLLCGSGV